MAGAGMNDTMSPGGFCVTFVGMGNEKFAMLGLPLISRVPRKIFISYTHQSRWSSDMADQTARFLRDDGMDVFLDKNSIPGGSLWKMYLLRGASECEWFFVIGDEQISPSNWVLAESAYVSILRKAIWKPRVVLVVWDVRLVTSLLNASLGMLHRDVRLGFGIGSAVLGIGEGEFTNDISRIIQDVGPLSVFALFGSRTLRLRFARAFGKQLAAARIRQRD